MIEETAVVSRVEGEFAWVETQRKSTCGACQVNKGCGTSLLEKVLGQKRTVLRVTNQIECQSGDTVIIGIAEHALVKGSLAVYAVPLISMFGFGIIGGFFFKTLGQTYSESWQIMLSLSGLGIGFLWLRRYTSRIHTDGRYQPRILRRVETQVHFSPHLITK